MVGLCNCLRLHTHHTQEINTHRHAVYASVARGIYPAGPTHTPARYMCCEVYNMPRRPLPAPHRLPRRPPRRQYTAAGFRSGHKHRSTAKGVVGLGVVEFYGRSRSDLCGSRSFMLPNRRFYGTLHAKITRSRGLYTILFPQNPQGCGKHSLI